MTALRWLLPVVLVFGVCLMHTVGHLEHSGGSGTAVHETAGGPAAHASPSEAVPGGVFAGPGPRPSPDPGSVCLAVLTSLLLLLLLALAGARAARRPASGVGRTARGSGSARAPPRRVAPTLWQLSVMRV
ncbi:hypothetical protein HII36_10235 [Nonomuraea sp. NN258]|uniref:DUF6153 family protein n=1 Tax=Nonomuraea antri TaxID=2730852 RepID=UPI0015690869|nr:DUF6153 family protein [Nonomuraea antri]NRQ32211.1 hypothetical protein [Nonomuraea antri]